MDLRQALDRKGRRADSSPEFALLNPSDGFFHSFVPPLLSVFAVLRNAGCARRQDVAFERGSELEGIVRIPQLAPLTDHSCRLRIPASMLVARRTPALYSRNQPRITKFYRTERIGGRGPLAQLINMFLER